MCLMDSVAACPRSSNTGSGLERHHWVFAIPDAADRQILLKTVARQCILSLWFARVTNSIVRALLEIGKVRVAAVLGQFPATRRALRRARPATDAPPARSSSTARPGLETHSYVSRRPPAQVRPRRLTGHSTPLTMTPRRLLALLLAARAITTATASSFGFAPYR